MHPCPGYAERRIALVIDNSNYASIPPLRTANDTRLIVDTLCGLGCTPLAAGLTFCPLAQYIWSQGEK
jgi:hypothetical protein